MKKSLISLATVAAYLSFAPTAFAENLCPTTDGFDILCRLDLGPTIANGINLIFIVAVIVALVFLIYGGFRWLTSTGDEKQVAAARDHIVAAVIGLVIIFLSYFIINFLVSFFIPGFSLRGFDLPTINGGTQGVISPTP